MINKKVIVWVDGCFDLFHFGHANALRQARNLGQELVVGIHSDAVIKSNKREPIFTEEERYRMVRSMKWVDKVAEDVPYTIDVPLLDKYECEICTHGDDVVVTSDGVDSYEDVKAANRFKTFKRTPGISTTDIISRIINRTSNDNVLGKADVAMSINDTRGLDFMTTSLRIAQFQENLREPTPEDIIIYAPGSYDVFHVGHCMFLEQCSKFSTYVIVGLYGDDIVKSPIMSLYERLLSVLSCKYVSNVVVNAPHTVTNEMMDILGIHFVVHGVTDGEKLKKIFEVPMNLGRFKTIESGSDLTLETIINRIKKNQGR